MLIEGFIIYVIGCYLAYINSYNAIRWGRSINLNISPAKVKADEDFCRLFAATSWVGVAGSLYVNWKFKLKQGLLIKLTKVNY